ncbi:MAG: hypothetical protein HC883_05545 [Bdellovibrionaceae bacterium]|nr:hypothetical protein [Pseudobdellovibrionaceae bacterium]
MISKWLISFALLYISAVALIACSNPAGDFFYGALGLGEQKILVATNNAGAPTIVMYDMNGEFVRVVADYASVNDIPKGIAPFDAFNITVLLDGVDRLSRLPIFGGTSTDFTNTNLTGTLFHLAYDSKAGIYYAAEGNTIEAFTAEGVRSGNPYINTPLGSCALNVVRGLAVTSDQRLFVVGTGNDDLNVYDVSTSTAACLTANTTFGNIDPVAVIVHSNGLVYVATQGDDRVYSFANDGSGAGTVVWDTDLLTISNPTALLELPMVRSWSPRT